MNTNNLYEITNANEFDDEFSPMWAWYYKGQAESDGIRARIAMKLLVDSEKAYEYAVKAAHEAGRYLRALSVQAEREQANEIMMRVNAEEFAGRPFRPIGKAKCTSTRLRW